MAMLRPLANEVALIRLRQSKHFFGDKAQNQLGRNRGNSGKHGFTHITLYVLLLGVAHSSMRKNSSFTGTESCFCGEIFRRVGFCGTAFLIVIQPCSPLVKQCRRFQIYPSLGQWVLDALVHADRPVEHYTICSILCTLTQRDFPKTGGFRGKQNPFWVHTVKNILKALSFFSDSIV